MEIKICKCCKKELQATKDNFYVQKRGKYGVKAICKICENIRQKQYRLKPEYREKHRIQAKNWRKNNPEKALEINRKSFNKRRHIYNEKRKHRYHNDMEYKLNKDIKNKIYRQSEKGQLMLHKDKNITNSIERSKNNRANLSKCYIAQLNKIRVKDMNNDEYEIKKTIIELKRELNIKNNKF